MGVNERFRIWGHGAVYGFASFLSSILIVSTGRLVLSGFELADTALTGLIYLSLVLLGAVAGPSLYYRRRKDQGLERYEKYLAVTSILFSILQAITFSIIAAFFYILDELSTNN